jgi:hypothetical protein
MIRVTSVTKGHRVRSQPVRFSLSQVVSAGPSPDSRDDAYLSPPSYPSYGGTAGDPSTYPMMPTFIAPPPRSPSSGPYRNNRLTGNYTSVVGLADYRFPPTANSAGVVYVRGEEVGIVILVLIGKSRVTSVCCPTVLFSAINIQTTYSAAAAAPWYK